MMVLLRSLLTSARGQAGKQLSVCTNKTLSTSSAAHMGAEDPQGSPRPTTAQAATMLDIGTRSIFNSQHDIFRESVRKFFDKEIKPHHQKWEEEGIMPKSYFKKAGEAGLLSSMVPQEMGGLGASVMDIAIVCEEQGYSNCSAPGFSLQNFITTPYVVNYATEQARNHYLPQFISGDMVPAIGMTEPNTGSDLQSMRTNAKRDGDDWIINGSKIFITNGHICDVVILAAVTQQNKGKNNISLFLVDANAEGFKRGRNLKKLGIKGQDTAELFFEDVRVPGWCLLGEPHRGFPYMMTELPLERLGVAVAYTAASEYLFEITRTYIKEREAFGKPLAKMQTIAHKMAEMKIKICAARSFVDQCILECDSRRLSSGAASMAKVLSTDLSSEVSNSCLQLHGGYGFMEEYEVCRAFRDLRVGPIYAGTNEIMKELIARDITA